MKNFTLPKDHRPYTDKYFLRSNQVLKGEGLNPFVTAQTFLRSEGKIYGLNEAIAILNKYSAILENGGKVFSLKERAQYHSGETVLLIQGRIQDIVELETMMLSVISAETTMKNDKIDIDIKKVTDNMAEIVSLVSKRPVFYFGARHWRFDLDPLISQAAFAAGAIDCSTDIGALAANKKGVGTIPHSLQNIFAWKYGEHKAVLESLLAFDRHIEEEVPRIALVDYYNREIADSVSVIEALQKRLFGIRIDTCGENLMQGAIFGGHNYPNDFWGQRGVSISGVMGLISHLEIRASYRPKIILSSGFANPKKVQAFIEAEKIHNIKLFDGLGVGAIFPGRFATMDIVEVGEDLEHMQRISKVGRSYHANMHRLKLVS